MSNNTIKIVFTPSGIRGEVESGTDILTAARKLGADLDTVCGGNGLCGRCKIRVGEGSFPKYQITSGRDHLSPPAAADYELFTATKLDAGFRLGCKAKLLGDVIIDIPPESQVHQQVVRKNAADIEIEAKHMIKLKHQFAKIISENTGKTMESTLKDMERDYWMDANETISDSVTVLPLDNHSSPTSISSKYLFNIITSQTEKI